MSTTFRLDLGEWPKGIVAAEPRYRSQNDAGWVDLKRITGNGAEIELPSGPPLVLQVRAVDSRGVLSATGREVVVYPTAEVDDNRRPSDLTVPSPEVSVKAGVVMVIQPPPQGQPEDDYTAEIRISEPEEDEAQAVLVGEVAAGQPIEANQWPVDDMLIHSRLFREEDSAAGTWNTTQVATPAVPPDHVEVVDDAGTAFSGWTFETLYGYTPLEVSSGLRAVVVPPIWNTTNTDSIWGMTGDVPIWALMDYFPFGEVTSPAFSESAVHEFLPVSHPEFSALTLVQPPVWGMHGESWNPLQEEPSPDTADYRAGMVDRRKRLRDLCVWNTTSIDRAPVELEEKVSLSQDAVAYDAFETLQQGRVYRARALKRRLIVRSRWGRKRTHLSKWRMSRFIRNKKWEFVTPLIYPTSDGLAEYTFSPVPEIVSTPTAIVSVEATDGDGVTYSAQIESLTATVIKVRVTMTVRDTVVTSGGTVAWTYPAAFQAAPVVLTSPRDAGASVFAGITGTPTTTAATVYCTTDTGATADKTIDVSATGIPPVSGRNLHIVLTGY